MKKTWTELLCSLNGNNLSSTHPAETYWLINAGDWNMFVCRWRRFCSNSVKLLWLCFKKHHAVCLEESQAGNPLTQIQVSHSNNHKTSGWSITGSFQSWSHSSSSSSGWGKRWSQSCGCRSKASCGRRECLLRNVTSAGIPTERTDRRTYWKPVDKCRPKLLLPWPIYLIIKKEILK